MENCSLSFYFFNLWGNGSFGTKDDDSNLGISFCSILLSSFASSSNMTYYSSFFFSYSLKISACVFTSLPILKVIAFNSLGFDSVVLRRFPCALVPMALASYPSYTSMLWIKEEWFFAIWSNFASILFWFSSWLDNFFVIASKNLSSLFSTDAILSCGECWKPGGAYCLCKLLLLLLGKFSAATLLLLLHEKFGWLHHPRL